MYLGAVDCQHSLIEVESARARISDDIRSLARIHQCHCTGRFPEPQKTDVSRTKWTLAIVHDDEAGTGAPRVDRTYEFSTQSRHGA